MLCPTCPSSTLVMSERSGIEIDYCPTCRGVWLDRGELDKLIERSAAVPASASGGGLPLPSTEVDRGRDREWRRDDDDSDEYPRPVHGDAYGRPRKKKRGSFLGEIFDF